MFKFFVVFLAFLFVGCGAENAHVKKDDSATMITYYRDVNQRALKELNRGYEKAEYLSEGCRVANGMRKKYFAKLEEQYRAGCIILKLHLLQNARAILELLNEDFQNIEKDDPALRENIDWQEVKKNFYVDLVEVMEKTEQLKCPEKDVGF